MELAKARGASRGRAPERNPRYLLQGLILLVAVALLLWLADLSMHGRFSDTSHVTAVMTDIGGGVAPGADVKMRGVVVGRVTGVGGTPSRVLLDIEISNRSAAEIPGDVQARVLPASVFGTSYVDLLRPQGGAVVAMLRSGASIVQDTSAPTIELQQALDNVDKLVKALGPADLSVVLHRLAASLDGRGTDLGTTVARLNHLLGELNPKIPILQDDLKLLVTNLHVLRTAAPDVLNGLVDTTDIAKNIVAHRADYARLLVAAVKLVDDGDGFLDRSEQAYVRAIIASADVSNAVYDNRAGISRQAVALDELLKKVLTVTEGGPVRIDIRLVNAAQFPYYTSADCPRYGNDPGTNCGRG